MKRRDSIRSVVSGAIVAVAVMLSAGAAAQRADVPAVAPFSGSLQRIHESGVIRVGHRENSPPFAYLGKDRQPIGYALDLCDLVIDAVAQELHKDVRVERVPVTPANRFDLLASGAIDLECGSTTASAERRALAAFSPAIFVTGTKLLVRRGSPVRSLRDLQGKTVVLTTGTIQAEAIPKLAQRQKLAIQFVFANDHDESLRLLLAGKADAFANDDVQLHGMVAATGSAGDLRVVGELLTYADYALMLRRDDPEFAAVVERAFERMASSGEIKAIYRKWFQQPLPSGGHSLNLPMSPHLEHVYKLQGLAAD